MEKGITASGTHSTQATASHATPPNYSEAASSSSSGPVVHQFARTKRWSSKVFVRSEGVDRYCFAPGKNAQVWIYAGTSTKNTPLGYLTFPTTHNAFRLYFGAGTEGKPGPSGVDANGFAFSDVKARIGYPHASSFSFKGVVTGRTQGYEWVNRNPSEDASPVQYDLSVSGLEKIATLTVNRKGKDKTSLRWSKVPENELEQAFLILSAIGVITRLSRKGMYRDMDSANAQRWFAFWWMAALSTAAVM